jgi:nucleoside-diphosphate-sugar epimerase
VGTRHGRIVGESGPGVQSVVCDALDRASLDAALRIAQPEVVINQMTALPARIEPRRIVSQYAATNRLRSEGGKNLIEACTRVGVRRFIAQSVAFAYAPAAGLMNETCPLFCDAPGGFTATVAAIQALENSALGQPGIQGVVLRYGYLYGAGTHLDPSDGYIAKDIRSRRFPIVGSGGGVFSFIHIDDAVSATVAAVESQQTGIFNIVDDNPAAVRDWLPWYAKCLGAPAPFSIPVWIARAAAGSYGVYVMTKMPGASNSKARRDLAWRPSCADWRDGFGAMLGG